MVRVPDSVRGIIGKSELSKHLYATNFVKANRKRHRVVAELMEVIEQAKRDLEGTRDKVSRVEKLREFALDFRRKSDAAKDYVEEDLEDFFEETIDAKVYELYGSKEASREEPKSIEMKFYRIREGSTNVNGELGNLLNSLVLGDALGTRVNKTS